jgi:Protein kinase domain
MSSAVAQASRPMIARCSRCGLHHANRAACPIASMLPLRPACADLAGGTVLAGRFKIQGIAHRSDFSTVYRALDLQRSNQWVAVKQVSVRDLPADEQSATRAWLAREAGLLSSLHNQHLPQLIAAFSENDEHFVVMPFLAGETLKQRVERDGPLAEEEATHLAATLAYVLSYLHEQDPPVVHRDLKPANILLCDQPSRGAAGYAEASVVLLDLGAARPVVTGQIGTAIGTPGYAPPEQYQGLADEQSDLYALGATMHFMLTGYEAEQEAPFRHPPVRNLRPEVSTALARMVTALLRLPAHLRPQSALLVGRYLGTGATGETHNVIRGIYAGDIRQSLFFSAAIAMLTTALTICARLNLLGLDANDGNLFFLYLPTGCNILNSANMAYPAYRRRHEDAQVRLARRRAARAAYKGGRWIMLVVGAIMVLTAVALYAALPNGMHWLVFWLAPPAICLSTPVATFTRLRSFDKTVCLETAGLRLDPEPYDGVGADPVLL